MKSSLTLRVSLSEHLCCHQAKRLLWLRFLKNPQGSSPSAGQDAKMACLGAMRSVIRFMEIAGVSLESLIDQQRTD
jgi:hypothetical protein